MSQITAEAFKDVYEQATREQRSALLTVWPNRTTYTAYVKSQFAPRIAELLLCGIVYEHDRIDIVLTKAPDSAGSTPTYLDAVVALEHENDFGKSTREMFKLQNHPARLGVLTTFARPPVRIELLERYTEVLANAKNNHAGDHPRTILVIFGPYGMNPPRNLEWEYFTFEFELGLWVRRRISV